MPRRRKIVLTILILLALVVVALAVIVPRLADIDRYRPEVVAQIERSSGRQASIGRLDLRILPTLGVRADDIVIGNPPGFPAGHFLEIRHAYARIDAVALLRRQVVIRALQLESPKLSLVSDASGRWNTEGAVRAQARLRPAAWLSNPVPATVIASVKIEQGRVTAANILPSGDVGTSTLEAEGVTADLHDVNPEALGIHLAQSPGGELSGGDYAEGLGRPALMRAALIDSTPQSPAMLAAPPPQGALAARGTFTAQSVRMGAITVTEVTSGLEIHADGLVVKNMVLQLFGGRVSGDLLWNPSVQPPRYTTNLALTGIDVARALQSFPSANGKLTGTLDGKIQITGWTPASEAVPSPDPPANLQGAGTLTVRNGTLPAIRLNRDLTQLMKNVVRTTAGSPDPSTFQSMSADFEISDGEIRSRQITILGNGINLNVSGGLALAGAGKLDYRGTGEIMARKGVGNLVAGLLGSKMGTGGKITFPFTLTGTLTAPRFQAPQSPFLR
jgi:uncharacterized protein involved in outer membrane biogenesis